jgi:hypothetical protein
MTVAPVVSVLACGVVLLVAQAVVHFSFQQFLNGIGEKLLYTAPIE